MRIFLTILLSGFATTTIAGPPPEFTDLALVDKTIKVEIRYATTWNFVGRQIAGYHGSVCFLTKPAAVALSKVQSYVSSMGYSLLAFDCYRPQRAVADFVKWTKDPADQKMKSVFYPDEPKEKLVDRGYIADHSGHSRGSTIDLTLIQNGSEQSKSFQEEATDCRKQIHIEQTGQLDMGTSYDCFSEIANTDNPNISDTAKKNRALLKNAMEKFGFVNYAKEWWHYTLKAEPFKDQFFDFEVRK